MWYYLYEYNDGQIVENNILKDCQGKIPEVLNIRSGVKTVLGEKTENDCKNHRFCEDIFYNGFNQNNILKEIYFPNSVKKIGEKAFEHAHALSIIHLPDSLKEIKLSAFLCCNSLKYVTLPNNLKVLDTWCFCLIDNLIIKYKGTIEEFNQISKGDEWCNNGTKIICSDGQIIINDGYRF